MPLLRLLNLQVQMGEVMNLPTYNFFIRLAGTDPQEPTSGKTLLPEDDGDEAIADEVVRLSRDNYATKYVEPPKTKIRAAPAKPIRRKSTKAPSHSAKPTRGVKKNSAGA